MATDLALMLLEHDPREKVIACITLEDEHPDNTRIAKQYEEYFFNKFGVRMTYITNEEFKGESGHGSVTEVIKKVKYMSGVRGAPCTARLKKEVRKDFERPDDTHVFGFHADEAHRPDQVLDAEPELDLLCPLIDMGFNKQNALDYVGQLGLGIPIMYQLGYNNNNCLGCVKAAGAGYWNKIRKDFPEVFWTRSRQEKLTGAKMIKVSANKLMNEYPDTFLAVINGIKSGDLATKIDTRGSIRIPLRYLPEGLGNHKTEHSWDCGIFCELDDKGNPLKE